MCYITICGNIFRKVMKKFRAILFFLITAMLLYTCHNATDNPLPGNNNTVLKGIDIGKCLLHVLADSSKCWDCFTYEYNQTSKSLLIKHHNAGLNCGTDSLDVEINKTGNLLKINEIEKGGKALCDCLFDFEYKINNLEIGVYDFDFFESLVNLSIDEPAKFTVDLRKNKSGNICFIRHYYPW
jgi:hypothetical protein